MNFKPISKMNLLKHWIFLTVFLIITSCFSTTNSTDYEHTYKKYWEKYSEQQLKDSLFADTLNIGPDIYGGFNDNTFYTNTINELLEDIADDVQNVDSLFPMTSFDQVNIQPLPFGVNRTFNKKQIDQFLAIINDPVSFDWSETTYEAAYQIVFLSNKKNVASLTIGADNSVIKTKQDWPAYKKMKFGALKVQQRDELTKLIDEIIQ